MTATVQRVPELPEVETVRRELEPLISGRIVTDAWAHPSAKFVTATEVIGAQLTGIRRRGKYLLITLDDERELVAHLGMTGRFVSGTDNVGRYLRGWWHFDDGSGLEFHDMRRFGRLMVVPAGDYRVMPTLHQLGPEPFDDAFSAEHLWRELRASSARIKTKLLNQRIVAGVGNIYADEALWAACIDPATRSISRARAAQLRDAVRDALAAGLANGGTTLRDYRNVAGGEGSNQLQLSCYGRAGQECLRCGGELRRRVIDGRGTTWCPTCQRR